ncbi:ABC transporter permease [Nocardioides nanhaiensis]|uniref:ABC transporter permease n=1 Tax=Nocardioides nanhaiensis TaxID=1476871 RepID=A0ABP8W7K1_9ACTN
MTALDEGVGATTRPGEPAGPDLVARFGRGRRSRTLWTLGLALVVVLAVAVAGQLLQTSAGDPDLPSRLQPPSPVHPFGTDRFGQDLLQRTLVGLRLSLLVGTSAAVLSGALALLLALVAVVGGRVAEAVVGWLVDLFLALPHLVLLILISFALGGGTLAVVIAVAVTHWPRLTRVLIATGRESAGADHVAISRALGHGRVHVARRHLLPHLVPHLTVGTVLLFPHAILHEAALSFLGLGIDPGEPAIGILLADSMRSLSAGHWWLAVLPGLALLVVVKLVDTIGNQGRALLDPRSHHL